MSTSPNRHLQALLREALVPARYHYLGITLLGGLQTLNQIAFAAWIAWLVQTMVYQPDGSWPSIEYGTALIVLLLLQVCLPIWRSHWAEHASRQVRERLRERTLRQVQALGIDLFPAFRSSELSTLLSTEIDSLRPYLVEFLPQQRLAVVAPLLIALACLSVNWLVSLLLLLTAPLIPLFMILVGHKAAAASQRHLQQLHRLGDLLSDRLQGLEAVQLAGAEQRQADRLRQQSQHFAQATMSVLRLAFLSGTVLEFFAAISVALVAVYLGLFFLGKYDLGSWQPGISLGQGVFLLMLAPEFYLPLRRLGAGYHARADALSVAAHLHRLYEQPVRIVPSVVTPSMFEPLRHLTLVQWQFGYKEPLCVPLNAHVTAGSCVWVVAPSGVGKSTLLDTLAGLRPALAGQLLRNGQPLSPQANGAWQQRLGYLTQRSELLYCRIRDNLCLGKVFTDTQLWEALAQADIDHLVRELPGQLDYVISDGGGYLSGGQAQRIALARVFLHQVELLLLDEPTANLDQASAARLMQVLRRYQNNGGTLILVSHRPQILEAADQQWPLVTLQAEALSPC